MCAGTAASGASRWAAEVERALGWLLAQEHQHFRLLQQNEASDWADIMPRSGYVLYTNALWYDVKRRFALTDAEATHYTSTTCSTRSSATCPSTTARGCCSTTRGAAGATAALYLSFVNLSRGRRRGRCVRQRAGHPVRAGGFDTARRIVDTMPPRMPPTPIRCASCCIR